MLDSIILRRHLPFIIGAIAGVATALALLPRPLSPTIGANVFFVIYIVMTARKIPKLTGAFLREHAASEDEPAWLIFLVTLGAVVVAVAGLFQVMNAKGPTQGLDLGLALASVALGWLTIHTMAALHYAHRYWRPREKPPAKDEEKHRAGLDFPDTEEPGAYDFLYFAFVIGMTAQTADVDIENTEMRKLVLMHSVVAFFFNTVLVAATVNLAVSLAN